MKKILFYLLLILIWEAIYRVGVDWLHLWKSYIFPSPFSVFQKFIKLTVNKTLLIATAASMKRMFIGYGVSAIIGIIIGFFIVRFKYLDENLRPLILGLQTLPSICWLPFAILWCGLNEGAIIFVITLGSTFAIAIAVESGIKNINPLMIRAAKTLGARGVKLYAHVIIPASLPNVIAGLKQGWSFAWRALMAGEMLAATKGLGQVLMIGRDLADINQVMAVMMVIVFLGLLVDQIAFGALERKIRERWGLDRE